MCNSARRQGEVTLQRVVSPASDIGDRSGSSQKKKKKCDGVPWERFDLLQSQFMHRVSAARHKHFHPLHLFPARQPADDSCGGTGNFHRCHVLLHFQTDVNFMSGGLGTPVIVLQHENDVNFPAGAFTERRWGEAADDSCKDANGSHHLRS